MDFGKAVNKLKKLNDAVVLAHNYQIPPIQEAADYVGDSLGLARTATKLDIENIIFCGVDFMAESAAILNPEKNIIHPEIDSCCPLAEMVDQEKLKTYKKENPDTAIATYVNSYVETKALSDICFTSSSAIKILKQLKQDKALIIPDKNLAKYVERNIKNKEIKAWNGVCPIHHSITVQKIQEITAKHPDAEIIVHPECRPEVMDIAHHITSTSGILEVAKKSDAKHLIIGTEEGIGYRLRKQSPDKTFHFPGIPVCINMKKISPEKVLNSLKNLKPRVKLDKKIAEKAKKPLDKMLKITNKN